MPIFFEIIKVIGHSLPFYQFVITVQLSIGYTVKGKVFYGKEPPSGESTTIDCGFNYQLLAIIY